jgi:hypothetical protein
MKLLLSKKHSIQKFDKFKKIKKVKNVEVKEEAVE